MLAGVIPMGAVRMWVMSFVKREIVLAILIAQHPF